MAGTLDPACAPRRFPDGFHDGQAGFGFVLRTQDVREWPHLRQNLCSTRVGLPQLGQVELDV